VRQVEEGKSTQVEIKGGKGFMKRLQCIDLREGIYRTIQGEDRLAGTSRVIEKKALLRGRPRTSFERKTTEKGSDGEKKKWLFSPEEERKYNERSRAGEGECNAVRRCPRWGGNSVKKELHLEGRGGSRGSGDRSKPTEGYYAQKRREKKGGCLKGVQC